MSDLQIVNQIVSDAMNDIVACFKPGAKITVAVRTPGNNDADFLMTNDEPLEVEQLLQRRREAEA